MKTCFYCHKAITDHDLCTLEECTRLLTARVKANIDALDAARGAEFDRIFNERQFRTAQALATREEEEEVE